MARKIRRARGKADTEVVKPVEEVMEEETKGTGGAVLDDIDRIIAKYRERATTPLKAIRAKCVECMGGSIAEISRCTSTLCTLYPFRMGKNTMHALAKKEEDE